MVDYENFYPMYKLLKLKFDSKNIYLTRLVGNEHIDKRI
jgi:hypothetical protein